MSPLSRRAACIEIAFILLSIYLFTPHLQTPSSQVTITGNEFAFLVNSGQLASTVFKQTGAIPRWNPFVGSGEPLLENLFSFVLNPLMTLPMLVWDPIVGARMSLLLHIGLIGLGGWALGRMLGLRWGGRVLLGLMLAGNGSMASAMGIGFYQIALSLAYIPWIMVGFFGMWQSETRWPVALFAIATALMIFAGTFWYLLPAAISVGVLILFMLGADWIRDRTQILRALRRVTGASLLTLGISAVRLLPLANSGLYLHPTETLVRTYSLGEILTAYFWPTAPPAGIFLWDMFAFHYIVPLTFAAVVIGMWLLIGWRSVTDSLSHRGIVVPILFLIVLFTLWAQGGTPTLRWIYEHIPALQQWRDPARIAAMGAFWIAVLVAIGFDDVVNWLQTSLARARGKTWFLTSIVLTGLLVGAVLATFDVLINWTRLVKIGSVYREPGEEEGLICLRQQHPTDFLAVATNGMPANFTFYRTLLRATTGNPNVNVQGLPATLGSEHVLDTAPEYASAMDEAVQNRFIAEGYVAVPGCPRVFDEDTLWRNPNGLSYAFLVNRDVLTGASGPLFRADTVPISTYAHHIDHIYVHVTGYAMPSLLVILETAYPGWSAYVNKQPARLESIGGRLGVLLPEGGAAEIDFVYRPPLLYAGGLITVASAVLCVLFMLRGSSARRATPGFQHIR